MNEKILASLLGLSFTTSSSLQGRIRVCGNERKSGTHWMLVVCIEIEKHDCFGFVGRY